MSETSIYPEVNDYMKKFRRRQNIKLAVSFASSAAIGVYVAVVLNKTLPHYN